MKLVTCVCKFSRQWSILLFFHAPLLRLNLHFYMWILRNSLVFVNFSQTQSYFAWVPIKSIGYLQKGRKDDLLLFDCFQIRFVSYLLLISQNKLLFFNTNLISCFLILLKKKEKRKLVALLQSEEKEVGRN